MSPRTEQRIQTSHREPQIEDHIRGYTPEDSKEDAKNAKRKKLISAVAAVAGTAVVITGGAVGYNIFKDSSDEAENPNIAGEPTFPADDILPTAEAPGDSEQSIEDQIAAVEIPAGLTSHELALAFTERLDAWAMAGANDDLREDRLEANLAWPDFTPLVAADNKDVYASALFIDGWESDANLADYADRLTKHNEMCINRYIETAWSDPDVNLEAYAVDEYLEDFVEIEATEGIRILEMNLLTVDNVDKNELAGQWDTESRGTWTVTFVEVDGVERISHIEYVRQNA